MRTFPVNSVVCEVSAREDTESFNNTAVSNRNKECCCCCCRRPWRSNVRDSPDVNDTCAVHHDLAVLAQVVGHTHPRAVLAWSIFLRLTPFPGHSGGQAHRGDEDCQLSHPADNVTLFSVVSALSVYECISIECPRLSGSQSRGGGADATRVILASCQTILKTDLPESRETSGRKKHVFVAAKERRQFLQVTGTVAAETPVSCSPQRGVETKHTAPRTPHNTSGQIK
ncbi:hypothetical protein E2C01_063922 [Portunus trituberculatus]|uniref:Uncharacterized protein n=1 Tax=Portunus trituberculatus TaxID=210409 RepID=A0A5B7HBS4_PORTR|nr:hypothetical protein [Portunus trituberculatus]